MELNEYRIKVIERFKKSGIETPILDTEILISYVLGIEKEKILFEKIELTGRELRRLEKVIRRREKREPIAYITGEKEFYSIIFKARKGVLIPRPETEHLIDTVISDYDKELSGNLLDLCCGSGIISIILKMRFPNLEITGIDIDRKAIQLSKDNYKEIIGNGYKNEIKFIRGDLFEPVKNKKFDLIVSNPPYIKKSELDSLVPEIRKYENLRALDGGEDGMLFYGRIISGLENYLNPYGKVYLEIDYRLQKDLKLLLDDNYEYTFKRDYSGRNRILIIKKLQKTINNT